MIGTICHTKSPCVIEALGRTGLDFVTLDMEHCAMGPEQAAQSITAASAAGLKCFVRVSEGRREHILHMLDLGADGVIVPCVETVEQVKQLVEYAKFAPLGSRGYCMTRDGGWGFDDCYVGGIEGYMARADGRTLLIPQCETVGCLENIETITAMDGVDGILIGPYDLSIALGLPGRLEHPDVKAAINRIIRACKASGKLAMTFCGNGDAAKKALADGCDAAILGIDLLMLVNRYREELNKL